VNRAKNLLLLNVNPRTHHMQYRKCLRDNQNLATVTYTNDLHEALLKKDGPTFWKCWRSKFELANKCTKVDGCIDNRVITEKFAQHFMNTFSYNNLERKQILNDEYSKLSENYFGISLPETNPFDTELVSKIIADLKSKKAPDIAGLTSEHLIYSQPVLPVILSKLFNGIFRCQHVPDGFKYSYIVPVPKLKDCRTKAVTCNDFRAIAIIPVLCKVFEYCILDRFSKILKSSDSQFGFKKGLSCNHAVRHTIESSLHNGNTVN